MAHPTLLSRSPSFLAPSRRCLFSLPASSSVAASQSRRLHRLSTTTTTSKSLQTNSPRLSNRLIPSNYSPSPRSYHSQHHPDPPVHEYTNSQTTILSAALRHIPQHGFTRDALTLGARDAGFLDVSVQLFPRAEFDLILFWLASRRGLLRASVDDGLLLPYADASVDQKIKVLLMERLRMNVDIRHQWQDALALMSLPSNVPLSLSELHALSDDVLNLAGDSSVDAAWYTKRLSVSAIFASAEVVMTREAPGSGLADTEAFVDRRVEDVKALGDKVSGVKQCLGFMGSTAVGLGRSWGLKI
ncbi:ubiquinone biosynthesis protein COQ9 [Aspergillus steynii IBT 23096]|uniref:Ubiquinone biosynthesis protein n=1 Tax=Aspergillus steynii IBT 23096 TaxID=1392250 RepID=A0A2I2GBI9_9EURO|nr:ubiquinone biosynthesis protein COQ9 [Aspergillus steynii IBT 23096]PLB50243.1 ubiquinone biosynthesis protein COQ9 [Aspergillus steynii IBT 23096]